MKPYTLKHARKTAGHAAAKSEARVAAGPGALPAPATPRPETTLEFDETLGCYRWAVKVKP